MLELLAALEASPPAAGLRSSVWLYPLVNAGHIVGVSLLFGAIVPLDLRLLGCWARLPLDPLWQVLGSTAVFGLTLAIVFGALLFIARASEYVASAWFLGKMVAIGIGVVNALALRRIAARRAWDDAPNGAPRRARLSAALSIAAWLTALVLGRLVGYF